MSEYKLAPAVITDAMEHDWHNLPPNWAPTSSSRYRHMMRDMPDAPSGWQPIEMATKHGGPIDHWIFQSGYDSNGPVFDAVPDPSHYMPLPAPPA